MRPSVFTYAQGKKYLKLAFTLARSYRFHNNTLSYPFYIVSTKNFKSPKDLKFIKKHILSPELTGDGLDFKLNLNTIAPTDHAIFIDADSVIYGNIEFLFSALSYQSVNVIGINVTNGSWVDEDVASCCAEFRLTKMIRYCGAFYFIRKDDIARVVFREAAKLNQTERNFQKHRHNINEEPLISISLSKLNFEPLEDNGSIWSDLVQLQPRQKTSVFRGITLHNDKSYKYKFWLPNGFYSPKIIHMGSDILNKTPWIFEHLRLKAFYQLHLPVVTIEFCMNYVIVPAYYAIKDSLKLFRISSDFLMWKK